MRLFRIKCFTILIGGTQGLLLLLEVISDKFPKDKTVFLLLLGGNRS